jgi:hypothetical protein
MSPLDVDDEGSASALGAEVPLLFDFASDCLPEFQRNEAFSNPILALPVEVPSFLFRLDTQSGTGIKISHAQHQASSLHPTAA